MIALRPMATRAFYSTIAMVVLALIQCPPLRAESHWKREVFATNLRRVDNIVLSQDGSLYVSLERANAFGQVVHLSRGIRFPVLSGLTRADGLFLDRERLVITEEIMGGRVIALDLSSGTASVIARLDKPEGIGLLQDGRLVLSEDLGDRGRIVTLTTAGKISVIADRLDHPEGVAISSDDSVYVAESGAGRIVKISGGQRTTVLSGLNRPDQIAISQDGSLWITEDTPSGRVLRFRDGTLEVVLAGVNKPQGIAIGPNGWVYVAEQGANRIVRIRRVS